MYVFEALREIASKRGYSQKELAEKLGTSQTAVWKTMSEKSNPSVNVLSFYLKPMGYQVALIPTGAKLPEGCYVLESSK